MSKKFFTVAAVLIAQILSGCGDNNSVNEKAVEKNFDLSNAKDGTYTVESSMDEKLGHAELSLTIQDHKITNVEFAGYDLFGNVKDEEYGSLTGKDSGDYRKAQVAVKAIHTYPQQLLETQDLKKVDAISGATISYDQFIETTKKAVEQASK